MRKKLHSVKMYGLVSVSSRANDVINGKSFQSMFFTEECLKNIAAKQNPHTTLKSRMNFAICILHGIANSLRSTVLAPEVMVTNLFFNEDVSVNHFLPIIPRRSF